MNKVIIIGILLAIIIVGIGIYSIQPTSENNQLSEQNDSTPEQKHYSVSLSETVNVKNP